VRKELRQKSGAVDRLGRMRKESVEGSEVINSNNQSIDYSRWQQAPNYVPKPITSTKGLCNYLSIFDFMRSSQR
jgi:hypothetical protein